jgi:hypothetical protein
MDGGSEETPAFSPDDVPANEPDAAAGAGAAVGRRSAARVWVSERLTPDHFFELVATVVLGIATVAAAWSGYQAARWSGVQANDYVQASAYRVESTKAATAAGQDRLFDSQVFSQWLNAHFTGDDTLATIYERRFRDEFRVAFQAWLATDPFNNVNAPPGPLYMPQYASAKAIESDRLESQAQATFTAGVQANTTSDGYIFFTVIFASTLFLAGVSDRFRWRWMRVALLAMAVIALLFGLVSILELPIL